MVTLYFLKRVGITLKAMIIVRNPIFYYLPILCMVVLVTWSNGQAAKLTSTILGNYIIVGNDVKDGQSLATRKDNWVRVLRNQERNLPPLSYINTLIRESDAVMSVNIKKVTLDSCKTCTSTGKLYVIECKIMKKYLDKTGTIKMTSLAYTTAADTTVYWSGPIIVFLNKIPGRNLGAYKLIRWNARQATEFRFDAAIEKTILTNRKNNH